MTSSAFRVFRQDSRGSPLRLGTSFWRSLLCAAFWLAAGASSADTKPPLVTLVAGANQVFLPTADQHFEVRVPITVAEDKPIVARKVDVAYKEGRSDGLFNAFTVTVKPVDNHSGAALVVVAKEALWPGTYVVSVTVAASDNPKEEQSVVLNLTVPAPQVSASAKVVVTQLLYLGGHSESSGWLEVREISGKVGALGITPLAVNDAPAHGDPASASLKFEPVASAAAHLLAPAKFKVLPDGEFPLGTTTGHIDVVSPSLATPISVPFEVRAHRSELLILVVAALGTIFGWLVRVFLTQRQSLLSAKGAIAAANRSILRAKRTCADAGFNKQVDALFEQLSDAEETGDPKIMTDQAKMVEDEFKKLLDDIEKTVPDLTAQLKNLNKIADVQWCIPSPLDATVADLREPIRAATLLLNQRNVTDAAALIDRQVNIALPALARRLVEFIARFSKYMNEVAQAPFPANASGTAQLIDLATSAATATSEIKNTVRTGTLDETTIALTRAQDLYLGYQALANAAVVMAERLCEQASARLQQAFGDIEADFAVVRQVSVDAAKRFAEGDFLRTAAYELPADGVVEAWTAMLQKLSPTVAQDQLQEALSKAQWLAATDLTISAAPKPTVAPAEEALTETAFASAEKFNVDFIEPSGGSVQMAAFAPSLGYEVVVDPAKEIAAQGDARREFMAQSKAMAALQSLSFGALFIVGAYVVYSDNWVGTAKEMLAVFTLAFGVDLTSDGVLTALKKTPA